MFICLPTFAVYVFVRNLIMFFPFAFQSLDGFVFTLSNDGRFLYISETVSIYLGLSQVSIQPPSVCAGVCVCMCVCAHVRVHSSRPGPPGWAGRQPSKAMSTLPSRADQRRPAGQGQRVPCPSGHLGVLLSTDLVTLDGH